MPPEQTVSPELSGETSTKRPRLRKLTIKNFRSIGPTPVVIELDDIVVLVGPNNTGKSSILKAYEVVMSEGSTRGNLLEEDFPNGQITPNALPEIELETVVYDNVPGERWVKQDTQTGELVLRERWIWKEPGKPQRQGFDINTNDWASDGVPWGAANVAQAGRPKPHRVDAFADPNVQANEIIELLNEILMQRLASLKSNDSEETGNSVSDYDQLMQQIAAVQKKVVAESVAEIHKVENELSLYVKEIFPDYQVKFDARPEDNLERCVQFFKAGSRLLMGPAGGHQSSIELQGSGARRTLLWTALRILTQSEPSPRKKSSKTETSQGPRPNVLLLDEPEICLHPNAVRDACRVLYDLPSSGTWQVMVTTHSPAFIDISRDNTTIVRVERDATGSVVGTTVFRPERAQLDATDRQRLKLLNMYDPYVAEFFFGGRTLIVEGDTEYTAFRHVISGDPALFKDVHIVRARGKGTIVSLIKIMNQFGSSYSVLHDSDTPNTPSGRRNPAWTVNQTILNAVNAHPAASKVRLVASLRNFEKAFLGGSVTEEKPYNAIETLSSNATALENVRSLLKGLVNHQTSLPAGCTEWSSLEDLSQKLTQGAATSAASAHLVQDPVAQ
jgi:putative ATP-dependent endonuclease of OLD family